MGGIEVAIPNNDMPTTRICQEIANFDNSGANYRHTHTAFANSIELVETPHISNYGRGRVIFICDDPGI